MLHILLYLLLITEASNWNSYYDDALVGAVNSAFTECSAAYGIFEEFVSESLDNTRRRDEDKFAELEGIMKTCGAILEAANIFHTDPQAYEYGRSFGLITLRPSELTLLKSSLGDKSKGMGEVLYVASRDGDSASDFHSACDGKGPTIVIIQTTRGDVFGGYAEKSWEDGSRWISSSDSFLFSLRPEMTHYAIKESDTGYALHYAANFGPIFGYSAIEISSNAMSNNNSYVRAITYVSSDGTYLSGEQYQQHFRVADYVVLEAI